MTVTAKLAGFAVVLLATFGAAFGVGRIVGDDDAGTRSTETPAVTTTTAPAHEGGHP